MMKRVIVCVVLSAFFMTGCGEGDQAASSSQPQVEYASPETASVEIQNYMNADWLYDEYFGFNTRAKLTTRKSFGFRTYHGAEIALYHTLGALPEPESTHRFC